MNPTDTTFSPTLESPRDIQETNMSPTLEYVEELPTTQEHENTTIDATIVSNNSVEEVLFSAIFKSTYFSSKKITMCELTGKNYDDNNLIIQRLNGAEQLNNLHWYGGIQYHPENENLMHFANMYFEAIFNLLCNHSWKGLPIKIQRSSGQILETNIHENSCIRYFENKIMFYIQFIENDELYNKWVPLTNYYSKRRDKTDSGILSLNPELYQKEMILYIDNHPEWMNDIRDKWIELFTTEIEKTGIKVKLQYK